MKSLISTAEILLVFFRRPRISSDVGVKLLKQKILLQGAPEEMRFLGTCVSTYCMSHKVVLVLNLVIYQHSKIRTGCKPALVLCFSR